MNSATCLGISELPGMKLSGMVSRGTVQVFGTSDVEVGLWGTQELKHVHTYTHTAIDCRENISSSLVFPPWGCHLLKTHLEYPDSHLGQLGS